jgi:porin
VGSAVLNPGFGYTHNFDTDLAVLSWTQKFGHERVGVAFGRLAYDVYLDAFAFQTFSRGFFNRAFIVNPTLGTTGIGALGAVAKGFVSDHFWLGAQAYDGNAASGRFDFSTLKEYEWLWAVEFGWTPGFDRLKTDRIQLTYWNKDTRVKAGVPSGQGIALSMSWQISEQFLPFVRAGYSDGGASVPAEGALSAGLEYTVCKDQVWSVGLGWARPSEKTYSMDLRDEFVVETSYRVQVFPSFSLTPDLQLLLQPAQSPAENMVWVLGIRGILSF